MPSRLVVLKDPATDETASYLRFLIPDTDYVASGSETDFSGLVLYTTLSGFPVSVGKFCGGVLSDSASLLDDARTWEENVDRMVGFLQDIYVARIQDERVSTRMIIRPVVIGGFTQTLITANRLSVFNGLIEMGPDNPPIDPPIKDIDLGGGSGGGGSTGNSNSGNSSEKSYPQNPKITTDDEQVRDVLDVVYNDCMGQLLINAIGSKVKITSGYFGGSTVNPVVQNLPTGAIITGYEVKLGTRLDPIPVLEELMHVYQGVGTVDYRNAAMNNEVEAKLAWYMYVKRTGSNLEFKSALGGQEGEVYFESMRGYILNNDLGNPAYIEAYENAVGALRNIGAYKNEDRYPFDPCEMDCRKLMGLLKDCLNK